MLETGSVYVDKTPEGLAINDEGMKYLLERLTNPEDSVYSFFPDKISPIVIAAAMARLSRSPNPFLETLLLEFADPNKEGNDEALIKRVLTMFGDDSVQQLVGLHVVFEDVSNLATKSIERGRIAAYLEQSTRYIFYDEKDKDGNYKYFTPENLSPEDEKEYKETIDGIFDKYSNVVHKMVDYYTEHSSTPEEDRNGAWKASIRAQACDAARALLPVATKSTVAMYASAQAIDNMIMDMLASENLEDRKLGEKTLEEIRKVAPSFFERTDQPDRGAATVAYKSATHAAMKALAKKHLTKKPTDQIEAFDHLEDNMQPVIFTDSSLPKNQEFDLIPAMLFDHSDLSEEEIDEIVKGLSLEDQQEIFDAYFGERLNRRHKPGRALERVHYTFELICDYGIFRDLQRHRMVDDLRWQDLHPYLGYDVPETIINAGLEEEYRSAFDASKKLYESMRAKGYDNESQYATLLGHKMRWCVTFNARQAFHLLELRTTPQGHDGYRKLCQAIFENIKKIHPEIAKHMIFVDESASPALARLEAEKAQARKLAALEDTEGDTQ